MIVTNSKSLQHILTANPKVKDVLFYASIPIQTNYLPQTKHLTKKWQNLKINIILLCDVTAGYQNKENIVSALPQNREIGNNKLIYGNYTLSKQIKHQLGHYDLNTACFILTRQLGLICNIVSLIPENTHTFAPSKPSISVPPAFLCFFQMFLGIYQ